ncbi:hypothetical protein ACFQ2B_12930 [Streptomyces stramineus]
MHADGFGAAFCAAMAALCAEAVIAGTIGVLVMLSREHDGLPDGVLVIAGLVLGVALLTVLAGGFVTAVAVMPAVALARLMPRRMRRSERRRWTLAAVPLVAGAAVVVFGGVMALGSLAPAPPLAYLLAWGTLTAALLPAALIADIAGRRVRQGRATRLAPRVARDGALVWVIVAALGAGPTAPGWRRCTSHPGWARRTSRERGPTATAARSG